MASHHYLVNFALAIVAINFVIGYKIKAPSSPHFPSSIFSSTARPSDSSPSGNGLNLPKITLLNSSNNYNDPYYSGIVENSQFETMLFKNESTFIVSSSRFNLVFQCEANYPVFWNLGHSKIHPTAYNSLRVLSTRKFEDAFDPTTFSYVTTLTMNGPLPILTGRYSCQSSARHEIQTNIQVFWQSTTSDVFVHSKENVTITISSKDDIVELPCQITNPESVPKLQKETGLAHNPYQNMGLNDSVQFSPAVGYTLKNLPNPVGIYKCLLDGNDFVSIRVVKQNVTANPGKTYSFKYDDENKRVECCSSGTKPPKIYWMVCEHPSTCGFREHFAPNTVSYLWQQGRRRGNCTVFSLRTYHTGIIRCVGENFNVFKEFIAPLQSKAIPWNQKRNTTTYFRWEEIDPQEMININPSDHFGREYYYDDLDLSGYPGRRRQESTSTIYSHQNVHLGCHTSRYYFAEGTHWMVRWKNKTMLSGSTIDSASVNNIGKVHHSYYGAIDQLHSNSFDFVASTEMESVICFAPVWNSSVWVTKIHYLYVNETISPWIGEGKEIVKYTWYANDTGKELSCSGSGIPSPTFLWEKDNMTIHDTAHNYHVFEPNITGAGEMEIVGGGGSANNNSGSGSGSNGSTSGNSTFPQNRSTTTTKPAAPTAHSTLRILRVSYSTHGVFRCVATNFGGVATKEFHITVLEPKSWTSLGVFAGASVITLVLMTGIIYLLRKLHKDRQEIRQLTSVNFKDVTRSTAARDEGARAATSSNAGAPALFDDDMGFGFGPSSMSHGVVFDNGKMTNNLIDTF
ncbi:unnamed protein product [Orchesella dallaii]|uniref:Ig-like domain-containing protein n=1 Tax=Orchesella dallaii TaxID=48710 RepID=A0ABP1Q415_9HEXA